MSSLLRTVNRPPIRRLLQQRISSHCFSGNALTKPRSPLLQTSPSHPIASLRTSFSVMATLKSNAPAMAGVREFDPEIKDMASYVHNYKIDSDLAVCQKPSSFLSANLPLTISSNSMKPHATSSSIPLAAAWKPFGSKNAPSYSDL